MVAETLTSKAALSTAVAYGAGDAHNLKVATKSYDVAANVEAGDIFEMVKVPAGAVVVGGWVYGADLDTGIETLDFDIGWKANADEITDTDGFGNLGVMSGDAITELKPVAGLMVPFQGVLLTAGPKLFTKETVLQIYCNAACASFSAGRITMVVFYFMEPGFTAV